MEVGWSGGWLAERPFGCGHGTGTNQGALCIICMELVSSLRLRRPYLGQGVAGPELLRTQIIGPTHQVSQCSPTHDHHERDTS